MTDQVLGTRPRALYVLALLLGLSLLSAIVIQAVRDAEREHVARDERVHRTLDDVEVKLRTALAVVRRELELVERDLRANEADLAHMDAAEPQFITNLLKHRVESSPLLGGLIVVRADGVLAVDYLGVAPRTLYLGDRGYVKAHQREPGAVDAETGLWHGIHMGRMLLGRRTGRWMLPTSVALRDEADRLEGVIAAVLRPEGFVDTFSATAIEAGSSLRVLNGAGDVIGTLPRDEALLGTRRDRWAEVVADLGPSARRDLSSDTQDVWLHRVGGSPVVLEYRVPREPVHAQLLGSLLQSQAPLLVSLVCLVTLVLVQQRQERTAGREEMMLGAEGQLQMGAWGWDPSRGEYLWTRTARTLLGVRQEGDQTRHNLILDQVRDADEKQRIESAIARSLADGTPVTEPVSVPWPDGSSHELVVRARAQSVGGAGRLVIGSLHDVTELRHAERSAAETERMFRQSVALAPSPVMLYRLDGDVVLVNEAWSRVTGYTADELSTVADWHASVLAPADDALLPEGAHEVGLMSGDHVVRPRSGAARDWLLVSGQVGDYQGEPLLQATAIDVTERKVFERRMSDLAFHDALTGLPNRALFTDRLRTACRQAARLGTGVAVHFIDLDRFKAVNDSLGHPVGDELLRVVSGRLEDLLRDSDTVARFGGDEFGVVQLGIESEADARRLAERAIESISTPVPIGESTVHVGASIGIALALPGQAADESLLEDADVALYHQKSEVRGGATIYAPQMGQRVRSEYELRSALQDALEGDAFFLEFQPQIDLPTQTLHGVEGLLRWRRADGTLLPPAEFIHVAEEHGLIRALGRRVLELGIAMMAECQAEGLDYGRMSLNASPHQFLDETFSRFVLETLQAAGVSPRRLMIEVTESIFVRSERVLWNNIDELRQSGVAFAMDDFGTGYSSLSNLRRLPIHTLKVAREFVAPLPEDHASAEIAGTIISMADCLGLYSLAEGAETQAQVEVLKGYGCQSIQGFYYSRPLSGEAFKALLRSGRFALHEEEHGVG